MAQSVEVNGGFTPEEIAQLRQLKINGMVGEQASPDMIDAEDTDLAAQNYAAKAQADQAQVSQAGAGAGADAAALAKAGELTTSAGAAGANPYVAGAGMAMQGIAAVDQAKRGQEQAKIDAYNKKIMAERSAIRNLFA